MAYLPGQPNRTAQSRPTQHDDEMTIIFPGNAEVATIAGKWRKLKTGEIEATYTRQELNLCLQIVDGMDQVEHLAVRTINVQSKELRSGDIKFEKAKKPRPRH